ncbi:PP_RS20740 family protein [Acinetobacter sp. TR11]|uniref:PP_RS20740 family protein n=1 Tax=Acinetobacter sp. TR11 TaxID=3003393 RepID=UPI0022ABD9C3|nr:hypothetical protein [Acinetobacter sp. TR11]WAU73627.1 hypothetical protein O1450_00340 [Acinetobacter sp. TR11]
MKFDDFDTTFDDFGTSEVITNNVSEKKQFLPWHKPRKQWIRHKQWWNQIEEHIVRKLKPGIDTIKYFGLPGNDLLDIRFFQQKLPSLQKKICLFGLINTETGWSSAQTQLSKIMDLDGVDKSSKVEQLNFDYLENTSSIAFDKLNEFGCFDVVNLDFCENVIPNATENRLKALHNFMEYQFQKISEGWVLFITTRSSKDTTNSALYEELVACIDENLSEEIYFQEFIKAFSNILLNNNLVVRSDLENQKHINMLVVGLMSWLIKTAHNRYFKVKLSNVVRYDITGENTNDMMSMCFVFTRVMNFPNASPPLPTKVEQAKNPLNKLANIKNLDDIMIEGGVEYYAQFVKEQIDLLKEAGYHTDDYLNQICTNDLEKLQTTAEHINSIMEGLEQPQPLISTDVMSSDSA